MVKTSIVDLSRQHADQKLIAEATREFPGLSGLNRTRTVRVGLHVEHDIDTPLTGLWHDLVLVVTEETAATAYRQRAVVAQHCESCGHLAVLNTTQMRTVADFADVYVTDPEPTTAQCSWCQAVEAMSDDAHEVRNTLGRMAFRARHGVRVEVALELYAAQQAVARRPRD